MASTCVECGLPAESGALVNGKTFHPGCFRCKGCSCALAGVQFFAAPSGDVMCGTCIAQTGPKCGKCGTGMTSWVEAAGTKYHKECFNPTSPSVPLAAADQPMCSGCGKGLMGRCCTMTTLPPLLTDIRKHRQHTHKSTHKHSRTDAWMQAGRQTHTHADTHHHTRPHAPTYPRAHALPSARMPKFQLRCT